MKRTLITVAGLLAIAWGLAGCETTKGAGQDIQNTGENIQEGLNASSSGAQDMTNETMNQADNTTGMGAGMSNDTMTNNTSMGADSGTGGADTGVGSGNTGSVSGY